MAILNEAVIRVGLDAKDVQRGIKNISDMFGRIQKSSAQKLARAVANIASIHMFSKMTSEAKEFERTMSLISGRLGMTADKLANMQLAFDGFNKSGQGVQKLLSTISKGVSGVKFGDGKFVSKLAAIGIRYRAAGGRKSNEQIMYEMANWTRNQLARGRSEEELRYLLQSSFGVDDATFEVMKQGGERMKQIQKDFMESTGGVKIENTSKMRKAFDRLSNVFDTLTKKIMENLAPLITFVVEGLTKIGEFMARHDEITSIIAGIIGLLSFLTTMKWVLGVGSLLTGLGGAVAGVTGAVGGLVAGLGVLSWAILGVLAAIGAAKAGTSIGDWIGDKWSKWFGSGDRTTEEFWDNAVEEGKISWQAGELGKEKFVPDYKNKPKSTVIPEYYKQQFAVVSGGKEYTGPTVNSEDLPDLEQEMQDINLAQAVESGEVVFSNDIDVDVNIDKDGNVETTVTSNGQTNQGQTNHISYTGRAA